MVNSLSNLVDNLSPYIIQTSTKIECKCGLSVWNKVAKPNTNDLNEYVGNKNKILQYQCLKCLKIKQKS